MSISKHGILAALAGAVVFFFTGWLVYGLLLMDFFTSHTTHYAGLMNEMPNMVLLFLSHLVLAYFLVLIFERWGKIVTFRSGFINGLILGFLIMLGFDLYLLAVMNLLSYAFVFVDVIVGALLSGLIGGVIALILGMKKTAN